MPASQGREGGVRDIERPRSVFSECFRNVSGRIPQRIMWDEWPGKCPFSPHDPPGAKLPAARGRGRGPVLPPAAMGRDLRGSLEGVRLADEAVHGGAVLEHDGPDRER